MRPWFPMSERLLVLCQPEAPNPQRKAFLGELIEQCRKHRRSHLLIPPLYHIAESSKLWNQLAERLGDAVLLCWLHPRPAYWLLRRHGIVGDERSILNLDSFSDVESAWLAATRIAQDRQGGRGKDKQPGEDTDSSSRLIKKASARAVKPRWYPVIDGSRCVQCQHCLQFCLFGVYELDADGKVQVRNPDQCKPGCPACSRVCPQSAIMFPRYEKDAAIAGAPGSWSCRTQPRGECFMPGRSSRARPVAERPSENRRLPGPATACARNAGVPCRPPSRPKARRSRTIGRLSMIWTFWSISSTRRCNGDAN